MIWALVGFNAFASIFNFAIWLSNRSKVSLACGLVSAAATFVLLLVALFS